MALRNSSPFLKWETICEKETTFHTVYDISWGIGEEISYSEPKGPGHASLCKTLVLLVLKQIVKIRNKYYCKDDHNISLNAMQMIPCLATIKLAMQSGTLVPAARKVMPIITSGIPRVYPIIVTYATVENTVS